jgi:hypothetical protein
MPMASSDERSASGERRGATAPERSRCHRLHEPAAATRRDVVLRPGRQIRTHGRSGQHGQESRPASTAPGRRFSFAGSRAGAWPKGRRKKSGVGLYDVRAIRSTLHSLAAVLGSSLGLVGLTGRKDLPVRGLEPEPEFACLVGIQLELASHYGPHLHSQDRAVFSARNSPVEIVTSRPVNETMASRGSSEPTPGRGPPCANGLRFRTWFPASSYERLGFPA